MTYFKRFKKMLFYFFILLVKFLDGRKNYNVDLYIVFEFKLIFKFSKTQFTSSFLFFLLVIKFLVSEEFFLIYFYIFF